MLNLFRGSLLAILVALACPVIAKADGLRVSPVLLEVPAPGAATTLTLRNDGRDTITIQSRAFLWSQQGGSETLRRTSDVVVSPPAIKLAPGAVQTVRVVRLPKSAIRGEEAYRIVINEVPDQNRRRGGAVAFATELRIPLFFTGSGSTGPQIDWSLRNSGNATYLVARNVGHSRLRLADVQLTGASGATVAHPGLMGYVLGGSTMQWPVAPAGRLGNGANLKVTTDIGAVSARVAGR